VLLVEGYSESADFVVAVYYNDFVGAFKRFRKQGSFNKKSCKTPSVSLGLRGCFDMDNGLFNNNAACDAIPCIAGRIGLVIVLGSMDDNGFFKEGSCSRSG